MMYLFQDTAFWQKSFASGVRSTVPACDLAALVIFAVPWALRTVIGLSARAIETLPIFPTQSSNLTLSIDDVRHPFNEATLHDLHRWYKFSWGFLIFVIRITFLAWPRPLYRDYIFTESFFKAWVSVAIFWQFFAFAAAVVYPIYDGRHEVATNVWGMVETARVLLRGQENQLEG